MVTDRGPAKVFVNDHSLRLQRDAVAWFERAIASSVGRHDEQLPIRVGVTRYGHPIHRYHGEKRHYG